jgi:hypothetical protein
MDFNRDFEDSRNPDRQRCICAIFGIYGACEVFHEINLIYDTETYVEIPDIRNKVEYSSPRITFPGKLRVSPTTTVADGPRRPSSSVLMPTL